jgi:hypothetical protein
VRGMSGVEPERGRGGGIVVGAGLDVMMFRARGYRVLSLVI